MKLKKISEATSVWGKVISRYIGMIETAHSEVNRNHEPHSGGSRISQRWEQTYDFAKSSQKLNEIERIRTRGGVPRAP